MTKAELLQRAENELKEMDEQMGNEEKIELLKRCCESLIEAMKIA